MIRVRPATREDIPAILEIERATPTAAHWDEQEYLRALRPGGLPERVLLSAEDGVVHGFVFAKVLGPEWEIENVVVHPDCRRRGLGSQLLADLILRARSRGASSVYLEVRESNHPARKLYSQLGFSEIGRRKSYYSDPEEDALLFRLDFPQPLRIPVEGA